jgi:hypothetical protein
LEKGRWNILHLLKIVILWVFESKWLQINALACFESYFREPETAVNVVERHFWEPETTVNVVERHFREPETAINVVERHFREPEIALHVVQRHFRELKNGQFHVPMDAFGLCAGRGQRFAVVGRIYFQQERVVFAHSRVAG